MELKRNTFWPLAGNLQINLINHHSTMERVTQVYDSGACIYFYFAFNYQRQGMDLEKALHAYENIEVNDI
jgi:hypothetical protein